MAVDIVVVGSLHMDFFITTDHFPKPGESVTGGKVIRTPGGKGANQATAAARLGGHVLMVGRVGLGENGEQLIRSLQENGVDTAFISKEANVYSGMAFITVDGNGQNMIVVSPGANWQLSPEKVQESFDLLKKSDLLLLQLEIPMESIEACAKVAKENNIPVILNASPPKPLTKELIQNIRYLILNEQEIEVLTGIQISNLQSIEKAVDSLHHLGVPVVILMLDDWEAFYSTEGILEHIPPFRVEPVDKTGAMDAFVGGFAVAIGGGQSLHDAVQFAAAAAALAATKQGARPSLPILSDVQDLLQQEER